MIVNPEVIKNKYECGRRVAEWLMYSKGLPLLSRKNEKFFFARTKEFENALKDMPLSLKLFGVYW